MADVTEEIVETHIDISPENDNTDDIQDEDAVETNTDINLENDNTDDIQDEEEPVSEDELAPSTENEPQPNQPQASAGQSNMNVDQHPLEIMYNLSPESTDARLYQMFGFNPKAFCWKFWIIAGENSGQEFPELCNVPMLQHEHYVMLNINWQTLVQMIETENSGPSICADPTPISQVNVLWGAIKYPRPTWEIINDNINIWEKFKEFDTNDDGFITPDEVRKYHELQYWNKPGIKDQTAEDQINEMLSADQNADGMVNFFEFKRRFFVKPDSFFNPDMKVRLSRYAFVIVIPVLCLILLSISPQIKLSVLMGISIQLMYLTYFATLGYYFWCGSKVHEDESQTHYLYRVFSRPGVAQIKEGKWAPLRMPLNQIAWPLKCIHSVSEFSAVGGAMPSIMLANIGQFTWALITMHFMVQIIYNKDFVWRFSDLAVVIGVGGLVMLGTFEADPFNGSVNKCHMLGALAGFGTVIGYIAQQNPFDDSSARGLRPALSWLLAVLFVVFYWMWNIALAMSHMFELNSWGMYSSIYIDDHKQEEEEEEVEEEEDGCCLQCCCACCLLSGIPLIAILFVGTYFIFAASKHKRMISKADLSQSKKDFILEFQPSLPFWREDITPEIKNTISTMSAANVLFEGVVLLVGSTALSLYLLDYERECDGFCFDQALMLIFLSLILLTAIWGSYNLFGFVHGKKFKGGLSTPFLKV